ncbi:unnamed protein product [Chrysoparadoxa australica]
MSAACASPTVQANEAYHDGDISMYTTENLIKRKQNRTASSVVRGLERIWNVKNLIMGREGNERSYIEKSHFVEMMVKLHILIVQPPLEMKFVYASAERDWVMDSQGESRMSFRRFADSLFELVDIWTDTADEKEYCDMITRITSGIAKEYLSQEDGFALEWKEDSEIRYDPSITKSAVTMDDIKAQLEEGEGEDEATPEEPALQRHFSFTPVGKGLFTIKSSAEMVLPGRLKPPSEALEENEEEEQSEDENTSENAPTGRTIANLKGAERWKKAVFMARLVTSDVADVHNKRSAMQQYLQKGKKKVPLLKPEKIMLTIGKIYRAKAMVDKKLRQQEDAEGGGGRGGKRRKNHRFDRFVLQYFFRQFGTRVLARKSLRQLVVSLQQKGISEYPRIVLFARLAGIPAEADSQPDGASPQFRPFAATDYLLPLMMSLVEPGQDLDKWLGTGKEPVLVPRNDMINAIRCTFKNVPDHSMAMNAYVTALSLSAVNEDGVKAPPRTGEDKGGASQRSGSSSSAHRPSNRDSKHQRQGGRRLIQLDEALLATLPLLQAEEGWRLWLHTLSFVVMMKRWIRRVRQRLQAAKAGESRAVLPEISAAAAPSAVAKTPSTASARGSSDTKLPSIDTGKRKTSEGGMLESASQPLLQGQEQQVLLAGCV